MKGGDRVRTWLKEIRQAKNLTMLEVAKMVDISESYYSLIENGKRGLRPALAQKIASALEFEKQGMSWTKFFEDAA